MRRKEIESKIEKKLMRVRMMQAPEDRVRILQEIAELQHVYNDIVGYRYSPRKINIGKGYSSDYRGIWK